MNFIDKFFLRLFLLPTSIYERLDVNLPQLRAILSAKLTMDNRRPSGFSQMKRRTGEKKEINKATLGTMFGSLVMGLFFLYCFALGRHDAVTPLTFYFSMFIVMLCITLITDFTSVLIDVRDNFIILPKPINDATFVTARLLHIMIRIFIVVIPLSLPASILSVVMFGWSILLPFLLMIVFATMLSIFLINAVYILILQITTPTKFQSIISYIQIGFTVLIYAGYQVLPRMVNNSGLLNVKLSDIGYMVFYPPYWFAQSCNSLAVGDLNISNLASLLFAVVIPVVLLWVVVRFFAPSFNQKLAMITANTTEQKVALKSPSAQSKYKVNKVERIARLLTKSGSEYMGFLFTWKMMSRSRDFKMKVYPAIGYVVVMGGMLVYNKAFSEVNFNSLMGIMLMFTYFSCFIMIAAISNLPYSEKFKAGWIFSIAPIDLPGKIISGAVKSAMVTFYAPIVLLISIAGISFIGLKAIPNIILGCYNVISICSIIAYISFRSLPFSQSQEGLSKGKTFIQTMLTLIIPAIFGCIHWWISDYIWMVILLTIITALIPWLVFDEIKKLDWQKIKS